MAMSLVPGIPEVCSCSIMGRLLACLSCHVILAVFTLGIVGGCQLAPLRGATRPQGNPPVAWSGCVSNCTPTGFDGEIHILRQKRGDRVTGNTIVSVVHSNPYAPQSRLILILVSDEKTNWILVPEDGIRISQIVTITQSPGLSAVITHGQAVRNRQDYATGDIEVFLRGVQMRVGPVPVYCTSHAWTTATSEWKLYVGLEEANRRCPPLAPTKQETGSSSQVKEVVKRVIVTGALLLFLAVAVTLICFYQRRRAKSSERRRLPAPFLPPPTVVASTEPPLDLAVTPVESTAPPPYSPYEPPPAYETYREKRSTQREKKRRKSRMEGSRKGRPTSDKISPQTEDV